MHVETLFLVKTNSRELGLRAHTEIDIGIILDVLKSVSNMNYKSEFFVCN